MYLVIGFIPILGAVDKVSTQFLYLGILNGVSLVYFLLDRKIESVLKNTFSNNFVVILLILFWLWSLFSFTYGINTSEVIIESTRVLVYLQAYISLYSLIKFSQIELKDLFLWFSLILFIETSWVLYELVSLTDSGSPGLLKGRNIELRSFTGNINITAFAMVLKLPFLIFFLFYNKKIHSIVKIILLGIVYFTIFLLGSRGANLTLGAVSLAIIIFGFYKSQRFKNLAFGLISAFALSIILNTFLFRDVDGINYINRTTNLNNTSSQKRIKYYKYAFEKILENPLRGMGIGSWKIYSIESDPVEMDNYEIPFHVHNDFLEITAELGLVGFSLYFGIYALLLLGFIKLFRNKKIPEKEKLFGFVLILSIFVYLCDSFLNFPFTRPVMQIPNLFIVGLSVYLFSINKKIGLKSTNKILNPVQKSTYISLFIFGIIYSIYISFSVYHSMVQQKKMLYLVASNSTDYSKDEVYDFNSWIPNIDVFTVPIDALKANLLIRIEEYDSVSKFIQNGIKANPKVGYSELVNSVYLLNNDEKIDSSYYYAKKAYQILPNHFNHFDHYLNMIEISQDTLSLTAVYDYLKENYSQKRYQKYLQVSSRMKNNISITDVDLIKKLTVNNPLNSVNKGFNIMSKVGRENVRKGYSFEKLANNEVEKKNFKNAAKLYEKASEFNNLELSYFENAANCYMKINENQKAIAILEKTIINLQPKTGKAEYLLGIIYLDLKEKNLGCSYLNQARGKGFVFNDLLLDQFCSEE